MNEAPRNGQIVTFYSYKGGVGRTMALANVAFLAAWNKKRVLVMDWDLEAPGVAYYFRGLLEKKTAKEIKQSEGVLDILWNWSSVSNHTLSTEDLKAFVEPYENGTAFSEKVKGLIDPTLFEIPCSIDYLGAGAREVKTPTPMPYEEALATFSWKDFYSEKAGGYLLEKWIAWAKHNYDLILIDSRTGLADVSGICTMQLPDKVALCFVLNRQNIDGVAKVASAIRAKRQEQIELKAYAMRVSQRKTSEEDDARARAISELTRIGGFSSAFISDSLKSLTVQTDDNVPFYETLSFFNTSDPETDPLSTNYLRIAKDLMGPDLVMPRFDIDFINMIKSRLDPTQATIDYILELKSAQKDRAELELENLVEKAIQAEADGDDIKIEYIKAIMDAVRAVIESENSISGYAITGRMLDLLRSQSSTSPDWHRLFAAELVRHFETYSAILEEDEAIAILDEIDSIYLQDKTYRGILQRIKYRRKLVGYYIQANLVEAAAATLVEIEEQFAELMETGSTIKEFAEEIWEAEIDILLKQGDIAFRFGFVDEAVDYWRSGIGKSAPKTISNELYSFYLYELAGRLSNIRPPHLELEMASNFAINAIKLAITGSSYTILANLPRLITNASSFASPWLISEVTQAVSSLPFLRVQSPIFYGRPGRQFTNLLDAVATLLETVQPASPVPNSDLTFWADLIESIFLNYNRRVRSLSSRGHLQSASSIKRIVESLENAGIDTFKYMHLTTARTQAKKDFDSSEESAQ